MRKLALVLSLVALVLPGAALAAKPAHAKAKTSTHVVAKKHHAKKAKAKTIAKKSKAKTKAKTTKAKAKKTTKAKKTKKTSK